MTATIRPKDESAITSVAAGDIFLVDGTGGVRALAATSVAYVNAANTFVGTQTIGALVATTVNGNTIATGTGILILGAGKTLTAANTLALAGTDGTTMTFPATSATIARTDAANTFTGHQTIEGVTTTGATGTGNLVFGTSPALTTPSLGVATATSINKVAFTAPATGSTLTIADGKTLTVSNSLTLAGTDATTMTFPATSATIARTDAANTFTGTQTIGALVATTINGNTITTGTGVLTIAAAKTLTVSNSLTLAGTDGTTQTFPGTSGTVVTSVSSNVVTNAMAAQAGAATLKMNATAALANTTDSTIQGLTNLAAPSATLDFIPIYDHVSGTIKNVTPGAIATSTTSGVVSINGLTGALTGILTNTRLAKTANYTVVNADKGSTIALGGSAFFTLTLGVASGYDANFPVLITNEDSTVSGGLHTGRSKLIAINGYPTFILWPGQSIFVFNQNNTWRFDYPGRWRCQGAPTLNVDPALGSDTTGDGLSTGSGALATRQQAVYYFEHYIDCNGFGPTIQVAAGTSTENNVVHTHPIVGYHVISITGDTVTPSNCVWQVSGTGNTGMQCRDGGMAIVTGFKMVGTGTNGFFLNAGQEGVLDYGSMEFGANPGGYHLNQSAGGSMNWFGGSIKCSGNMNGFFLGGGEGHHLCDGMTVNISAALTFFQWMQMNALSFASATSITFTGAGAGAASTGSTYTVTGNAVLSKSGTTFPGTSTSGAATGGQII